MNKLKKISAICICVVLSCATGVSAFSDIFPEDWFYNYINRASQLGIMQGYDNMAMPYDSLTKEQCVAMLKRSIAPDYPDCSADYIEDLINTGFSDWAFSCGAYGFKSGITSASDFLITSASSPAPRALIAKWTAKALGYPLMSLSALRYTDKAAVKPEDMVYIDAMYRYGIMRGDNADPFASSISAYSVISRGEFAKISTMVYDLNSGILRQSLENSVINISGKVHDFSTKNKTLIMDTDSGSLTLKPGDESVFLINGKESDFSALSSLNGQQICMGTVAGSHCVLVSTEMSVQAGELSDIKENTDFTALTIDGAVYYIDGSASVFLNCGPVSFIAEGAHILEIK